MCDNIIYIFCISHVIILLETVPTELNIFPLLEYV